jgi:hypothetical protein
MMTMLLMLLACLSAWALVGLMLGDARGQLLSALDGRAQGGGWMPSALPLATVRAAPSRPMPSRSVRRR